MGCGYLEQTLIDKKSKLAQSYHMIKATTKDKTNDFMHQIPSEVQKILTDSIELSKKWNKLTPLSQNEWICWITIVKKEETKLEHLKRFKTELLEGKKRPCCWPGCPHRRPDALKWFYQKEANK
jgi:uncharacterized protein YdeI (YjbR/CyaY-like superfamily)